MPIYDYQCEGCGHLFELRQGFDAASLTPCPKCGARARRKIYAPAVIYKGSGFYTTDYKRKENNGFGDKRQETHRANGSASEGDGFRYEERSPKDQSADGASKESPKSEAGEEK